MPRYLALEWDEKEARVVAGRGSGTSITIDHVLAIDLAQSQAANSAEGAAETVGESAVGSLDVGQKLAAALSAHNISLSRIEPLIAIGRNNTEVRRMDFPPSPPEEWPDMVRFQAMRQFTQMSENWAVDFSPVGEFTAEEEPQVLGAAVSPAVLKQIDSVCDTLGCEPSHLVLRPFAAAALLQHTDPSDRCRLAIDWLAGEADLTLLRGDKVGFVRTVRLPSSSLDAQRQALLGEIRRTMAAAQNQFGGQCVDEFVLMGDAEELGPLKEKLAETHDIKVSLLDPFSPFELAGDAARSLPTHRGRFAPLLGLIATEAAEAAHAIDFLHPKERPAPPSQMRLYALGAAAACLLIFSIFGMAQWRLSSLQAEAADLRSKHAAMKESVEASEKKIAELAVVDNYLAGDISWLDELANLSDLEQFPSPDDARLSSLFALTQNEAGGRMILEGNVSSAAVINRLEAGLRDEQHSVTGIGGKEDPTNPTHPWVIKETVFVSPELPKDEKVTPVTTSENKKAVEQKDDASRTGGAS